jgi:hypothetical protein
MSAMKTATCLMSMGCLFMLLPGLGRAETIPSPKAPTGLVFWTTADDGSSIFVACSRGSWAKCGVSWPTLHWLSSNCLSRTGEL